MLKTDEKRTLTELTQNEQEVRAARITAAELLRDDALARRDEVQRASLTDDRITTVQLLRTNLDRHLGRTAVGVVAAAVQPPSL